MEKREPEVILVDLEDHPIGKCGKLEAHLTPRLHRAFSAFLVCGDEVLLQKRASGKYHSGGLWANSCCSHPRPGEETAEAAERRIREELGIGCRVAERFSFVYCAGFENGIWEYEYDHVLLGRLAEKPVLHPDPEEIESVRWVPAARLAEELLDDPARFAVWFRTAAPAVLRILGTDGHH